MSEGLWRSSTEGSDSNSSCMPPSKRPKHESPTASMKFKGVVLQQNGHWGAQIYANHQRIWLGTFRSEREAAMAYDSAAIKLRSGDAHRNFPHTNLTLEEPNFQALHTTETVLNMIKDGSYDAKFAAFLRSKSASDGSTEPEKFSDGIYGGSGIVYQQLFQKELTPSDVGKLNRLVIPKKHAVKFFPPVLESGDGGGDEADGDEVQLLFLDSNLKTWKFRYCYWKSSQSFVFTRGWNRFVKEKELKSKDVVCFYKCSHRESFNQGQAFCMIDVQHHNGVDYSQGIIDSGKLGYNGDDNLQTRTLMRREGKEEEGVEDQLVGGAKVVAPATQQLEKKGVRLFGVLIT